MLSDARQDLIKKIAFRDGEVIISKAAEELGVSLETVRRDINVLCTQNILSKVHGGAVPIKITEYEDNYMKRKNANASVKKALGIYVSDILKDSKIAFFSVGTTIESVAASCNLLKELTVITNSVSSAEILGKYAVESGNRLTVTLAGGHFNANEHFTYGSQTQSLITNYRADVALISAVGIDENGAMCSSDEEGIIISQMIRSSDRVILVAESSKFSKKSVYRFCSLDSIDEIVTDSVHPIPKSIMKILNYYKITVHTVKG